MSKMIPVSTMEKYLKNIEHIHTEDVTRIVIQEKPAISIEIKFRLAIHEMIALVRSVVNSCFDKDTNEYMPEAKDFAIKLNVIEYFTNIKLPSVSNDTKDANEIIKQYDYVNAIWTAHGPQIVENIDAGQYDAIIEAIEERINYRIESDTNYLRRFIEKLSASISAISEQFGDVFSGLTKDDIESFVAAISNNGKYDEERLAKVAETWAKNRKAEET